MRRTLPALVLALVLAAGCSPRPTTGADAGSEADSGTQGEADAGVVREPFSLLPFDDARITSLSAEPNFQKIEAEVDWGNDAKQKATLVVDLRSTCYPFEGWQTNPPPSGQNWPADCDAFDRNFEFILDPAATSAEPPGFELVRAITPFGGPLHFEIDVTDLLNGLPGKHTLRSTITTWPDPAGKVSGSAGGWNVTARIDVVPGHAPRKVLAVIPLFNGSVTTPGDGPSIPFTLPEGTVLTQFEYRATGHGGGNADADCIGPAEEFCQRVHTLKFDGVAQSPMTLWRTNCADLCTLKSYTWPSGGTFTYCGENPCGAQQSVRAPRANWCPGSLTPPYLDNPAQWSAPGAHQFQWNINKLASGGQWRLSATVYAYGL